MRLDSQTSFVEAMRADGLVLDESSETAPYRAALEYARSKSADGGGYLVRRFAQGLFVEYPESPPLWFSREHALEGIIAGRRRPSDRSRAEASPAAPRDRRDGVA